MLTELKYFIDDQGSWERLREEGEFSTDEDFFTELADQNNLLNIERSECIQV